jgi:hypothetical protein
VVCVCAHACICACLGGGGGVELLFPLDTVLRSMEPIKVNLIYTLHSDFIMCECVSQKNVRNNFILTEIHVSAMVIWYEVKSIEWF